LDYATQVESISVVDGKATQVTCSTSSPQQQQQKQQQQQRSYAADAVVLAAGTGCPQLAGQAGCQLPLLDKPAAIVMTAPMQLGLLKHMVISDTVFMLQVRLMPG
jgi:glycine/D-amino acid oxidase-like deaminating enzyme